MDVSHRERGVYRFGPFRLDPARRALLRDGERVKLAERLFDTLLYLVVNQGRLVERDELLREVWGGRVVEENNLAQAIFGLRKALQVGGTDEKFIVTTPGRGYRLATPVLFEPEPLDVYAAAVSAAPDSAPDSVPDSGAPPVAPPAAPQKSPWLVRASFGIAALALVLAGLSLSHRTHIATQAPGPANAVFAPPAHSVAVLAFDNLTGDPGQTYLTDGLSEQLIDSLTAVDGLQVVARASSFFFRGGHATIADIARKLNVSAVLEGSVRRDGTHLRITAQLVNALTGFAFWSRTFDRPEGDILALQGDIAKAVTQSLQVSLLGGEQAQAVLGGTANPAAYDAYLRAMKLVGQADSIADYQATIPAFDAALALDPKFARAHAARAFTLGRLGDLGAASSPDALHKLYADALAEADRAEALAPDVGVIHSDRGMILGWGFQDRAGDAAEQEKALALTPGSAGIELTYAEAEAALGHIDEAVAALRRVVQLDPISPRSWQALARGYYYQRHYDAASDAMHHVRALKDKLSLRETFLLGAVELMRRNPEAAREACAEASGWQENEILAMAYHALGRQADADAQLAALRAKLGDLGAYNYAVVYAQWGQTTQALGWFAKAVELRDTGLKFEKLEPLLDPIRNTPQFEAIEHRLAPA